MLFLLIIFAICLKEWCLPVGQRRTVTSQVSSEVATSFEKPASLKLQQILIAQSRASLLLSIGSFSVVFQTDLNQSLDQGHDCATTAGVIMQQLYISFVADAFFKAAVSLVPEVPKLINVDGKMRPSDAFLLEFLCNFFSTLLVVPVSHVFMNST